VAAFNKEVQTLDGLYSTSRENLILSHLTSDQLVEINLETGEYEGALAASYAWVDDRTIDFTLREGLTFHDGAPVPSKTLYIPSNGSQRLCCTNRLRDSSRESSVVAGMHEQTDTHDLQNQELASLQ
jgi:MarR-like DNA-binding transcriptional regulator SgrR of sgrS sRNA